MWFQSSRNHQFLQRLNPQTNRVNGFTPWQSLRPIVASTRRRRQRRRGRRTELGNGVSGRQEPHDHHGDDPSAAGSRRWMSPGCGARCSPPARCRARPRTNSSRSSAPVSPTRPEWTEFFVEMIVEHVVWQSGEPGVLGEAEAKWLSARVDECEIGQCARGARRGAGRSAPRAGVRWSRRRRRAPGRRSAPRCKPARAV